MDIALQVAFVVGFTAVIAKVIPENLRNSLLPLIAALLGVIATTAHLWMPEGLPALIAAGIAIGGSSTGMYAVTKQLTTGERTDTVIPE